jgi:hypothetical protein
MKIPPGHLTLLFIVGLTIYSPSIAQWTPSNTTQTAVIFSGKDSTGFRDASWGRTQQGDYLKLLQTDKLPIDSIHKFYNQNSGVLEWRHVPNGDWELAIACDWWSVKDLEGFDSLVFYVNAPASIPLNELPRIGLESANNNSKTPVITLDSSLFIDTDTTTWQRVSIPLHAFQPFGDFRQEEFKTVRFVAGGITAGIRTLWINNIYVLKNEPFAMPADSAFLDTLQQKSFMYFWNEANFSTGLTKDKSDISSQSSIAAVGFGLTALCIGAEHKWMPREAVRDRVLATLRTLWLKPQGPSPSGTNGYKGWFYHFLNLTTGVRTDNGTELSSIDSALLLAGVLFVNRYFDRSISAEDSIRALSDSLFNRVDWKWMAAGTGFLRMGWFPESGHDNQGSNGFILAPWIGYNEAMILLIMAIGATHNPVDSTFWQGWTDGTASTADGYKWETHYNYSYINFPPLFGHQFSHCWIDFRNIQDEYLRKKGAALTYFENSRRATLAAREYCITNPLKYPGYSSNIWGITACDGPPPVGYRDRGAPPSQNDDGTIAPTAAGGSIAFTPTESIATLKEMLSRYRADLWGPYGFRDAMNINKNWFSNSVIGIDQGPIIIMIENYRTGKIWEKFMQHPVVQNGLKKAGFQDNGTQGGFIPSQQPNQFELTQNYPNPFNPATTILYTIPDGGTQYIVSLRVYDVLGRNVATLVNERKSAGSYSVAWNANNLSSGVYFYRLSAVPSVQRGLVPTNGRDEQAGSFTETRKLILLR